MNMQVEVLKSKIHRVTITQANLSYVGSITIDEDLLDAAHLIAGEKVQIVNVNNGERLETYIIKGERGSGAVCLNGPAARKCVRRRRGDHHFLCAAWISRRPKASRHGWFFLTRTRTG